MTIRDLFFVFVILSTSGMTSLCIATPIVVDYSVIPKVTFNPSPVSKQLSPSPQTADNLIKQQNNAAPPVSISIGTKEFQTDQMLPSNNPLPLNEVSQQNKDPLIYLGLNFNGFQQTNSLEENIFSQQSNQPNQSHASLNLKNILRDTVKDNEILMELAEGTVEVYRSFSNTSATEGFQTASTTVSFGNANFGASRDFLDAPPLIAVQRQAPTAQRSWGEESFLDKLVQFCFSWKGLLTLCGFLIFNSILFKLV